MIRKTGDGMRVVVTGARGRLGPAVVELLRDKGFEVSGIDREIELRDLALVTKALAVVRAVVHLAAIPSPKDDPPEVVYGNNTISTFHVFEAAAQLGIRRRTPAAHAVATPKLATRCTKAYEAPKPK